MLLFGYLLPSTIAQEFDSDYAVITSGYCNNHELCQDIDTEEECKAASEAGVLFEGQTWISEFDDKDIPSHPYGCTFEESFSVEYVVWNPSGIITEASDNSMVVCDCTLTWPPTGAPSEAPSNTPTLSPSVSPTHSPTSRPSVSPTNTPTNLPTFNPTELPTPVPSMAPTEWPTPVPTSTPTTAPSPHPTQIPTLIPTTQPSEKPTASPTTLSPTRFPTLAPSQATVGNCAGISLDIKSLIWSGLESVFESSIVALFEGTYSISGTRNGKSRWYMQGEKAEFYWSVDQWRLVPKGDYHAAASCGVLDSCVVPPVNGYWTLSWNGEVVGFADFKLSCDKTPSPTFLDENSPTIENCDVLSSPKYWIFSIGTEVEWPEVEVADDEDDNVFLTKQCTINGELVTCGVQVPGPTLVTYTAWDYGFHNTSCDFVIFYLDESENIFESIECLEFGFEDVYIFEDYALAHDYCSRTGDGSLPNCDGADEIESFLAKDGTGALENCVWRFHVLLREDFISESQTFVDSKVFRTISIASAAAVIILCSAYCLLLLKNYLKDHNLDRNRIQEMNLSRIKTASFLNVKGSFASEFRSVASSSKFSQRQSSIVSEYLKSQAIRRSKNLRQYKSDRNMGLAELSPTIVEGAPKKLSNWAFSVPGVTKPSEKYVGGKVDDRILRACTDIRPEPLSLPPCWSYDKSTDTFVNEVLKRKTKVPPVWFGKDDLVYFRDEVNSMDIPARVLKVGTESSQDDVEIELADKRVLNVTARTRDIVLRLPWPTYEAGDYAEAIEGDESRWVRILASTGEIRKMPMYKVFYLDNASITNMWPASLLFPPLEKWSKAQVSEWLRTKNVTDVIRLVAFHKGMDGKILANCQTEGLVDDYGFTKADAETLTKSIASIGSNREYKSNIWSINQVETWLRAIGMEHYAYAFKQNTITGARLRGLRRADLRGFGVSERDLAKLEIEIRELSKRDVAYVN